MLVCCERKTLLTDKLWLKSTSEQAEGGIDAWQTLVNPADDTAHPPPTRRDAFWVRRGDAYTDAYG